MLSNCHPDAGVLRRDLHQARHEALRQQWERRRRRLRMQDELRQQEVRVPQGGAVLRRGVQVQPGRLPEPGGQEEHTRGPHQRRQPQ